MFVWEVFEFTWDKAFEKLSGLTFTGFGHVVSCRESYLARLVVRSTLETRRLFRTFRLHV